MRKQTKTAGAVLLSLLSLAVAGTAQAQDSAVSIELSAAQSDGQSCLLSFVVENAHPADISAAVYETVLFDAEGGVALLTLLDFQDLPSGRPRVRQFQFNDMACDQISRVLINGAETCTMPKGSTDACTNGLRLKTRLKTEFIG